MSSTSDFNSSSTTPIQNDRETDGWTRVEELLLIEIYTKYLDSLETTNKGDKKKCNLSQSVV